MKTDHLNVAVAFGNDGYEQDPRSQLEVARFRDVLQQPWGSGSWLWPGFPRALYMGIAVCPWSRSAGIL